VAPTRSLKTQWGGGPGEGLDPLPTTAHQSAPSLTRYSTEGHSQDIKQATLSIHELR